MLLHSGFLKSADVHGDRAALHVGAQTVTYAELRQRAARLAVTLQCRTPQSVTPLVAVLAERSVAGYAGILGVLMAGRAYVPLNPSFPTARTRAMLQRADCRALIVDSVGEAQLPELLDGTDRMLVLVPERDDTRPLTARWPQHDFVGEQVLEEDVAWTPQICLPDALAYLLFTSGSTGTPKGVMVTHANAVHFVETALERYRIRPEDRFSQTFDTTFDLSVFDIFVAWSAGACVCCPSRKTLLNPDAFIREHELTIWFSVPSVGNLMDRFGSLKPGRYPSLRWSLFCGESLTSSLAAKWAAAAPRSIVENLYGPTELTVACSAYRWDPLRSLSESTLGIVPIGTPLRGMHARVVNDVDLTDVAPGDVGELLMTGPQTTPGYWRDDAATSRGYVKLPGSDAVFYRTGDRVRCPVGEGPLTFLGRLDHQVKVRGYRVELGEVESTLLEEPGVRSAVALGWPITETGASGLAAFVTGHDIDAYAIRQRLESKLQAYAVPQRICILPQLPYNANGKVDRHTLMRLLQAQG